MNHVILPSKEFSSLCTHPIRLPAYSDAGPGLGHCNIMAHPRFTLTSRAQTGFSSPSSFFTLSSVRTFTHFSLALFPHFFFNLVVTFAIFQHAETEKTPPPQSLSPLPLPPSNRSPLSSLCISLEIWQVTGPFHPSTLFFSPPLSPIPSLSHTVHR